EQHFTAARAGFLCGRGIRVVGDVVQLSDAGDHHWPADAVSVDAAYAHCAAKFVGALRTERESSVIGVLTRDRIAIDSDVLRVIRARESDDRVGRHLSGVERPRLGLINLLATLPHPWPLESSRPRSRRSAHRGRCGWCALQAGMPAPSHR